MTTMLDKMAIAMANVARERAGLGPTVHPVDPEGFGMLACRAALLAIREPSEGACRARGNFIYDPDPVRETGRAFTAVIDAILNEDA